MSLREKLTRVLPIPVVVLLFVGIFGFCALIMDLKITAMQQNVAAVLANQNTTDVMCRSLKKQVQAAQLQALISLIETAKLNQAYNNHLRILHKINIPETAPPTKPKINPEKLPPPRSVGNTKLDMANNMGGD